MGYAFSMHCNPRLPAKASFLVGLYILFFGYTSVEKWVVCDSLSFFGGSRKHSAVSLVVEGAPPIFR